MPETSAESAPLQSESTDATLNSGWRSLLNRPDSSFSDYERTMALKKDVKQRQDW